MRKLLPTLLYIFCLLSQLNAVAGAEENNAARLVSKITFSGFSQEEEAQLKKDLIFLGQIKTVVPPEISEHYPFLGNGIDGEQILELIVSRVKYVKHNASLCKKAGGCSYYGSNTIWIKPQPKNEYVPGGNMYKITARLDTAITIRKFLHEYYHIINTYDHIYCDAPGGTCDAGIGGAYGFTMFVMMNIAKYCTNCRDEFRGDAIDIAMGDIPNVIDGGKLYESMMAMGCPDGYTKDYSSFTSNSLDRYPICNYQPTAAPR